jgi:S1-C subfamily serine protease
LIGRAFLACLAATFGSILLASSVRGLARDTSSLRIELEESKQSLSAANREIASLREETLALEEAQHREPEPPRVEVPRHGFDSEDIRALYHDVLAPSVQVSAKSGVGGGTLLYSRDEQSYVITAYHVVQKGDEPADVRLYDEKGEPVDEVEADLIAHDEKKDLALLKLRTDRTYAAAARPASRAALRSIRVFTPLYAIGCPLGHDPLPTLGEVAALRKDVGGENFRMMTAPTIFGNSGGGVFHRETREMIGVSVMICTYDGAVSTPVPHLGIFVSMETIYDWLDSLGFQFLYDPSFSVEACERARAERAPVSAGDR